MQIFNFKKLSLSKQFLAVAMGTISLLILGVTIFMVNQSIAAKTNESQVMTNGRSAAVIEKIERNFYERVGDARVFADNPNAYQVLTNDSARTHATEFINKLFSYYVWYDLSMVCDINGKVVAANTVDKSGKPIDTNFLVGKDVSTEDWFVACRANKNLEGGAWVSDFTRNDDVHKIYAKNGFGVALAAPIKNAAGEAVGVWYNFADWQSIVTDIRVETQSYLQKTQPNAFILITDSNNNIIDSDDATLVKSTTVSLDGFRNGDTFTFAGRPVSIKNHVVGSTQGKGAFSYQGKKWNAVIFIPRVTFSFSYLIKNLAGFTVVMLFLVFVLGFLFYKMASIVSRNIQQLKNDIEKLSQGEAVVIADTTLRNEIGEMTKATQRLVNRMSETAQFAQHIGEGNLDISYAAISQQDLLGNALVTMRNNLQKIKQEEAQRTWVTEGLAKFGEILRSESDVTNLADLIIAHLVKYLKANQGGIFVWNDDNENDAHLQLTACYAWERKKYIEKKIAPGEGLVGQCWLEKDPIYITQVPSHYVKITSGLGESTPRCILILPLKLNDQMFGVIELASFTAIEKYQWEFLTKLSENIAAVLSTAKVNERTKALLQTSQQQSEELKAQEEEMRQNMEELNATHEEMSRKEQEYIRRIEALEHQLQIANISVHKAA